MVGELSDRAARPMGLARVHGACAAEVHEWRRGAENRDAWAQRSLDRSRGLLQG